MMVVHRTRIRIHTYFTYFILLSDGGGDADETPIRSHVEHLAANERRRLDLCKYFIVVVPARIRRIASHAISYQCIESALIWTHHQLYARSGQR